MPEEAGGYRAWGLKESDAANTECIYVKTDLTIYPTFSLPLYVHKSVLYLCEDFLTP